MPCGHAEAVARLLAEKGPELRLRALRALGKMGPAAARMSEVVAQLLADESGSVRQAAAETLRQMQVVARYADALAARVADKTEAIEIRKAIADVLVSAGLSDETLRIGNPGKGS